MPNFYGTNAVYAELARRAASEFLWASGSSWCLVYGDADARPKLFMVSTAVNEVGDVHVGVNKHEQRLVAAHKYLADAAGLPLVHMRFATKEPTLTEVGFRIVGRTGSAARLSMEEFAESAFRAHGLDVAPSPDVKPVKDKTSSGYHEWQRASLTSEITVSDIDLFRVGSGGVPREIFELKRSGIAVESWNPFPADYDNYRLLFRAGAPASVRVFILYNLLKGSPGGLRTDVLDQLALWEVIDPVPQFRRVGYPTFDDFVAGTYGED